MILNRPFWVALLVLPLALFAQSPPAPLKLSLNGCLELAQKSNVKLESHQYAVRAAEWRHNETKAAWKPVFEVSDRMAPVPTNAQDAAGSFFSGDITFFNGARIAVGVPVYTFGKFKAAGKLASAGIAGAKIKREKDRGKVGFDVKQLYYGILLAQELRVLASDVIRRIDDQLKKEEETKEHTPYEIAKLKIFKIEVERKLAETREKEFLAQEALKLQLNLPPQQSVELTDRYLDPVSATLRPLENYLETARTDKVESKLIDTGVKAKELEWRLEKKKLLPNVGLGAFAEVGRTATPVQNLSATDDFNNPFNYTRAGIGLEIKGQFDIHGARARIRRLENEYHKALTEAGFAKGGIDLQIKKVYEEAKRSEANLKLAGERKKLAQQMVFLSKSNIDVGVGEEEEYTEALQLLLVTRAEFFKAIFDYNVALAKLEWKTGGKK